MPIDTKPLPHLFSRRKLFLDGLCLAQRLLSSFSRRLLGFFICAKLCTFRSCGFDARDQCIGALESFGRELSRAEFAFLPHLPFSFIGC